MLPPLNDSSFMAKSSLLRSGGFANVQAQAHDAEDRHRHTNLRCLPI
jgi:hypothetical protein